MLTFAARGLLVVVVVVHGRRATKLTAKSYEVDCEVDGDENYAGLEAESSHRSAIDAV